MQPGPPTPVTPPNGQPQQRHQIQVKIVTKLPAPESPPAQQPPQTVEPRPRRYLTATKSREPAKQATPNSTCEQPSAVENTTQQAGPDNSQVQNSVPKLQQADTSKPVRVHQSTSPQRYESRQYHQKRNFQRQPVPQAYDVYPVNPFLGAVPMPGFYPPAFYPADPNYMEPALYPENYSYPYQDPLFIPEQQPIWEPQQPRYSWHTLSLFTV